MPVLELVGRGRDGALGYGLHHRTDDLQDVLGRLRILLARHEILRDLVQARARYGQILPLKLSSRLY